jgi:carotenoid cleavage dioxygenase
MTDPSRFLQGPFAPVTEEVTAFDLPVSGRLPAELSGRYLRNGPNPIGEAGPNYHWFLGDGMVHGVRLRDGRAEWYRNRWVRSKEVADALGETWPAGPTHDGMDFAANTHIVGHGGRVLATVEAGPLPYQLTDELETVGPCDFGGTLPGGLAAHTKADPRTGELHAVAYYWAWDHLQHVVIDAHGMVSRTTDVPVADGPMVHDFGLTDRYVVLLDLPVTFSLDLVATGHKLPYTWNPDHPARVGLLPRTGAGEVCWVDIDPCFVFHVLNAYDDGDRVVVDVCRYDRAYDVATLTGPGPLTLDRWTIDPGSASVTSRRLDDVHQEFPRIDDRLAGHRHRYGYTAVIGAGVEATVDPGSATVAVAGRNALLKHDLELGRVDTHDFGARATVGEGVFAPAVPDAAEDDGYVLAFVDDPDRGTTDLVVLAAQDFTGEPVARVHLPTRVPLGFHGNWLPDA